LERETRPQHEDSTGDKHEAPETTSVSADTFTLFSTPPPNPSNHRDLNAERILRIQRTHGNQFARRLIQRQSPDTATPNAPAKDPAQTKGEMAQERQNVMSAEVAEATAEPGVTAKVNPGQPTVLVPDGAPEPRPLQPATTPVQPPTATPETPAANTANPNTTNAPNADKPVAPNGNQPAAATTNAEINQLPPLPNGQRTLGTTPVMPANGNVPAPNTNSSPNSPIPPIAPQTPAINPAAANAATSDQPPTAQTLDREPTFEEFQEEYESGRTTEENIAQAAALVEAFAAEGEQHKTALRTAAEGSKAQIAATLDTQIASVQNQIGTQQAAIEAQFNTAEGTLTAQAESRKTTTQTQFEQILQQIQTTTNTSIASWQSQSQQRQSTLQNLTQTESQQPNIIADQESARANSELEAAANRAIAIGEAEASKHSGDGADAKKEAARGVARQSADDIRAKKADISAQLRAKAGEFTGRYQGYAQGVSEKITAAGPQVEQALRQSAEQARQDVQAKQTSTLQGITTALEASKRALQSAKASSLARVQTAGQQTIAQLRQQAQQATVQLDQGVQQGIAQIDQRVAETRQAVMAETDPYLPGIQDMIGAARNSLQGMVEQGTQQLTEGATTIGQSLTEAAASFNTQAGEIVQSAQGTIQQTITQSQSSLEQVAQSSLATAQQSVQSLLTQQQGQIQEALAQVDQAVNRARTEMQAVTSQFRNEARSATNESITQAKKPLTDPLEGRAAAAASQAGRSWWEGLLSAIGELIVGFLIIVAIALVVAALTGLTLGGALLLVGAIVLVIAFAAATYSRYQQNPQGGILPAMGYGLLDAVGISGMYEGITNRDIATGQNLNLDDAERTRRGTIGLVTFVGIIFGARSAFKARTAPPGTLMRPTSIFRGWRTYSLRANVRGAISDATKVVTGARDFVRNLYNRLRGRGNQPPPEPQQQPPQQRQPGQEEPPQQPRTTDPAEVPPEVIQGRARLQTRISEVQREIAALRQRMERSGATNPELNTRLQALEQRLQALESRAQTAQTADEIAQIRRELDSESTNLYEIEVQIGRAELAPRVQEQRSRLTEQRRQIDEVRARSQNSTNQKTTEDLAAMEREWQAANQRVQQLETELNSATSQNSVNRIRNGLDEAQAALDALQRKIDEYHLPLARSENMSQEAADAIRTLENLKRDPVGEVNSQANHNHYRAARREAQGEIVARKQDALRTPYDHIRDLQNARDALNNVRLTLEGELRNPSPNLTPRGRQILTEKLAETNQLLSQLDGFLSQIGWPANRPHRWVYRDGNWVAEGDPVVLTPRVNGEIQTQQTRLNDMQRDIGRVAMRDRAASSELLARRDALLQEVARLQDALRQADTEAAVLQIREQVAALRQQVEQLALDISNARFGE
jgi:phage shock protein A